MPSNGPIVDADRAPPGFDYEFREGVHPSVLTAILRTVEGPWSAHWIGDRGGMIFKGSSRGGLQRVRIVAWDTREIDEIARFVMNAALPLASDELRLHPVYPQDGAFVGWIFWHRRGGA